MFVRRESGGVLQDSGGEDSALDDERELLTLADPRSATSGPRRGLRTASGTIRPRYPEALKPCGRSLDQPPGKRGDPTRDSAPARHSFRPAGVSKSLTRSAAAHGRQNTAKTTVTPLGSGEICELRPFQFQSVRHMTAHRNLSEVAVIGVFTSRLTCRPPFGFGQRPGCVF